MEPEIYTVFWKDGTHDLFEGLFGENYSPEARALVDFVASGDVGSEWEWDGMEWVERGTLDSYTST